jgi:hypothetical protein
MTCAHCNIDARHPCLSRDEASRCGNNDDPGSCLNFDASDVAAWIESRAYGDEDLLKAAEFIRNRL